MRTLPRVFFIKRFFLVFMLCSHFVQSAPGPKGVEDFFTVFTKEKEVILQGKEGFYLSAKPFLAELTVDRQYLVLDNFNTRQIVVFDSTGSPFSLVGGQGKGPGEFLFPRDIAYSRTKKLLYVWDSDLKRISVFNDVFKYVDSFRIQLNLAEIMITTDDRLFGFATNVAGADNKVIFELSYSGDILNSFMLQSVNFSPSAPSVGGGMAELEQYIYAVTPYEFYVQKFTFAGERLNQSKDVPPQYVEPPKPVAGQLFNFNQLKEYHNSWSHIQQIMSLPQRILVIFGEPTKIGYKKFLAILDADTKLLQTVEIPFSFINFSCSNNRLYSFQWVAKEEMKDDNQQNGKIVCYKMKGI